METRPKITVIGDSTIDNKVWVKGKGKSVVQQLTDLLPYHELVDLSNDGFTTEDCLNGARRNKVFGSGVFAEYPNIFFVPLTDGREQIEESSQIILSIGGNDLREFIGDLANVHDAQKKQYISKKYPDVKKRLIDNYLKILERIVKINPNATIILMTQYYPSFKQHQYDIYPFMGLLSQALGWDTSPSDTIQRLMNEIYGTIIKRIGNTYPQIAIADVTATLNPHDPNNHVMQIEPSVKGGGIIANLLRKVILKGDNARGKCFSDRPNVSALADEAPQTTEDTLVECSITQWKAAHPDSLRAQPNANIAEPPLGECKSTLEECKALLATINYRLNDDTLASDMKTATKQLSYQAYLLLNNPNSKRADINDLKQSLTATLKVLESPSDFAAIQELQRTAKNIAPGKPTMWKLYLSAITAFVGAALFALGVAFIAPTGGISAVGALAGGGLMIAATALFFSGRQSGVSREMDHLHVAAKAGLTV